MKKQLKTASRQNMGPTFNPVRNRDLQRPSTKKNDMSANSSAEQATTPHSEYDFSRVRTHTEAPAAGSGQMQPSFGLGRLAGERAEETETATRTEATPGVVTAEAETPPVPTEATPEPETVREEETPTPAIIEPARIVRDKNLWWFDGENAANYAEEAKLTAFGATQGATQGTFRWDVVRGAGKVDFENNADSMTRVSANRIGIKSTKASDTMGDVQVRCRWSHGSASRTLFHSFTVRAPDEAVVANGPHDVAWNGGYRSRYAIEVRDQFNRALPRSVEVNESWGAFVADMPGVSNWFIAPPNGAMTGPPNGPTAAQFFETYGMPSGGGRVPTAVNPGAPGSGTRVMHAPQFYRAGSTVVGRGRLIKRHTARYYRGQGRQ